MTLQRISILHAGNMEVLTHSELTNLKEQYGHDALTFHRVDLHRGLLELALQLGSGGQGNDRPIELRSGCEVDNVDCEGGLLTLSNSEQLSKDLLVIADGAHVRSSS